MSTSRSICIRIVSGMMLLATLALFWGCRTTTDPDYTGVRTTARTDCKGDEIVGVWACSSPSLAALHMKASILLFRPDGTGLRRTIFTQANAAPGTKESEGHIIANHKFKAHERRVPCKKAVAAVTGGSSPASGRENMTNQFLWHYEGGGVWKTSNEIIRFTGNTLLVESTQGARLRLVYIRAGNESLNDVMKSNP